MKQFSMIHDVVGKTTLFNEINAPEWLTGQNTIKGSTMDDRWFWEKFVLTLAVGGTVQTEFHTITRLEDKEVDKGVITAYSLVGSNMVKDPNGKYYEKEEVDAVISMISGD